METAIVEWCGLKVFALGGFICSFVTYRICKMRMKKPPTYEIRSLLRIE